MLFQVKTLMSLIELFIDIVLGLINLQLSSVEDVDGFDKSSVELLGQVVTVLVESLQFAGARHVLDFVARSEQIFSLH